MKTLLLILFIAATAVAQTFPTVPLVQNGNNSNRINIAILGDGFTADEQEIFENAAISSSAYLLNKSPFSEYRNYFNVYAVKVVSNESGAVHPGTATDVNEPLIPVADPDTYFRSSFDVYGIHRLLYSFRENTVMSVLAANVPDFDIAYILVNSDEYGGAGGTFAFSSLNFNANEIVVHELGHSFAGLADEYWYAPAGESPNKTQDGNPATNRWRNWLYDFGTGIYPFEEDPTWFRPHQTCEMRYLNAEFCAVCSEQIIETIHSLVSPVDSFSPVNNETIQANADLQFEVVEVLPVPNTLVNQWVLNGSELPETGTSLTISPDQLNPGINTLVFSVKDDTDRVRVTNHDNIHLTVVIWELDKTNMATSDISAEQKSFSVYPVPAKEFIYIKGKQDFSGIISVQLYDSSGKLIHVPSEKTDSNEITVNVQGIPAGKYTLILTEDGKLQFSEGILIR